MDSVTSFEDMDLDPRLENALGSLGFQKPTLVQAKAIPLALAGKDILARARTGSGKTAAYCIPIIQKLLSAGNLGAEGQESKTKALLLVPTKELAEQVSNVVKSLTVHCQKLISVSNLILEQVNGGHPITSHVVVSTPSKSLHLCQSGRLQLSEMESLVVDEADLILSYGYEDDLKKLLTFFPNMMQSFLMSATLSTDVQELRKLVLRNPAILSLEESSEDSKLFQYYTRVTEADKFLLLYFLLKLRIHPFGSGKSIIFVNSIDRCYRVKLFLEQFGIKSCALNSELPLKSRYHILQEFNRGIYNFLIATDEGNHIKGREQDSDVEDENDADQDKVAEKEETKNPKKKSKRKHDTEYNASRGIDFRNVRAVISFDMPKSFRSYQHRVGRTARGVGTEGHAISFVEIDDAAQEKVLQRVIRRNARVEREVKEHTFDQKSIESFRYRCEDASRAVTGVAIREARLKEIKAEILTSEKLKAHFEDNPLDKHVLRHDKSLHIVRVQPHLKHVPEYLLTGALAKKNARLNKNARRQNSAPYHKKSGPSQSAAKKKDPLKSFSYGSAK